MPRPTFEPLGDQALLLRWGDAVDAGVNRRVHAFAARLHACAPPWLVDVVPAYASLALHFDPSRVPDAAAMTAVTTWLAAQLDAFAGDGAGRADAARVVDIPVCYGGAHGPDLDDVAAACGLDVDATIARHARPEYPVAMLGFSPGFPYLIGLDPALATPRLATPRARVPAGSVGIGGAQTGIYPDAGPGGWRLIGRTPLRLFDPARDPPSALRPGDRVRFVAIDARDAAGAFAAADAGVADEKPKAVEASDAPAVTVIAGGLQTTVQDPGRFGLRHLGVGTAGAVDGHSARVANLLAGNAEHAPLLEIALVGPRLRFDRAARIAITGADVDARVGGVALPGWRTIVLPAGSDVVFGGCRRGAYAYVAIAGGIAVPPVLGSAGTDLRAGFGGVDGRALRAGDALSLGAATIDAVHAPAIATSWIDPEPDLDLAHPRPLRVLPGRDAPAALDALCATTWTVGTQANRQGLRLQGPVLAAEAGGERISEPVTPGTVQLPPDGQPIVLLAEGQTIGGYPRIAHVIAADLPRLAQRRTGDAVRFEFVDIATAERAACEQRRRVARMAVALERNARD